MEISQLVTLLGQFDINEPLCTRAILLEYAQGFQTRHEIEFEVHKSVEGPLTIEQTQRISELLEKYKRREKLPSVTDYQFLRAKPRAGDLLNKRHDSDYYLIQKETETHCLIELKIGGDLDNKKARPEKV